MLKKVITTSVISMLCISLNAQANVKIYSASSLTNVMNALLAEFKTTSGTDVLPVYGGSSSLARQIERGAPADLFISANESWMQHLVKRGSVLQENVFPFTQNQLVLIAPKTSTLEPFAIEDIRDWQTNIGKGRLAIGNPQAVPAGIYARQTLQSLNVWNAVKSLTAPTSNVRMTLALVERGEAPLGIVYKTDALQSKNVQLITEFASTSHDPIRYPLAIVNTSPESLELAAFLQSEKAQEILIQFGFNSLAQ